MSQTKTKPEVKTAETPEDEKLKALLAQSKNKLIIEGWTKDEISKTPDSLIIKTAKIICREQLPETQRDKAKKDLADIHKSFETPADEIFSAYVPVAKSIMGNHRVNFSKSGSVQFDGYKHEYQLSFFNPANDPEVASDFNKYKIHVEGTLEKLIVDKVSVTNPYLVKKMVLTETDSSGFVEVASVQADPEDSTSLRASLKIKRSDD